MRKFFHIGERSATRQPWQSELGSGVTFTKDAFKLETLILMGAVIQVLLSLALPGRVAALPALLLTVGGLIKFTLQATALIPNDYGNGAIHYKYSAQLPLRDTQELSSKPADEPLCVFLLGARIHHPAGLLAPNMKEMGKHFKAMMDDLQKSATKYGLHGMSRWQGTDRPDTNMILSILYFRDAACAQAFAHDPVHRAGWDWYHKLGDGAKHIGIMHESFSVPAGQYETVYKNMAPTLLSACSVQAKDPAKGETEWVRPIVSAERGVLKTSWGRRGLGTGAEHDEIEKSYKQ